MRTSIIERNTKETKIKLELNIDGIGVSNVRSGSGFLDHMLTLFASHSRFDLNVDCEGDTYVDYHHSVEDIGICLGTALSECLSDKKGITRYGYMLLPMDESLVLCSLDISGRSYLAFDCAFPTETIGNFDTELVCEFFAAFARTAGITLHVKKLSGSNSHHIAEAAFKACARALRTAVRIDPELDGQVPSTKGIL